MTDASYLLSDLRLFAAAGREREAAIRSLVAALGPHFELAPEGLGHWKLPQLEHALTGVSFAVVPGGTFDMGLTDDDVEVATELLDWTPEVAAFVERSKLRAGPPREVHVEPFLCAIEPLDVAQVTAWTAGRYTRDTFEASEVDRWISCIPGFRLPSEAELEYLARDGVQQTFVYDAARAFDEARAWPQRGRFGLRRLLDDEWTADDWHDDYAGAPTTGAPWRSDATRSDATQDATRPRAYRGLLPDAPLTRSQLVLALAAARGEPQAPHTPGYQETRFLCARPVLPLGGRFG